MKRLLLPLLLVLMLLPVLTRQSSAQVALCTITDTLRIGWGTPWPEGIIEIKKVVASGYVVSSETLRDTARMQLRDAQILSPIRGVVAKRHAVVGEKLSFDQPILTVTNLQRLEITTLISAQDSTWLKPSQQASFQVDGLTKPLRARLSRVLPTADMSARAIPAVWSIDPGQGLVRPGQLASSFLEYKDSKPTLTLPAEAIREEGGKQLVWLIEEDKLKTRLVVLGGKSRDGKRVAVMQGIKEGDQILSQRFDNLKEGQPVTVLKAAQ